MIANFVNGLSQTVGNNHIFWQYADSVEKMGAKVNRFTCDDDLRNALIEKPEEKKLWVCYSNGMANLWRWLNSKVDVAKDAKYKDIVAIDYLIFAAGVARWKFGQMQGTLWHIPPCIKGAMAFNIDSIPVSDPIRNPSNDYQNISLDCPALAHITIVHNEEFKNAILGVAGRLL